MIMIASVTNELICTYLVKRLDHTGSDVQVPVSAQPPITKFFDNNGMLLHHTIGRQGEGHGPSGINFSIASEEMGNDQQEGRMSCTHTETDVQDKQTILDPQFEINGSGHMIDFTPMSCCSIASEDMENDQQPRQRRACERPSPRSDHLMSRDELGLQILSMDEQEDDHSSKRRRTSK
jgi:hypothetical protein